MFARKNTVFNKRIVSNRADKSAKVRCLLNLSAIMFLVTVFSLPLFSDDFPIYFRLKPDARYLTLHWEKSLFSEDFAAEQKIGDGDWERVPGLQKKVKVGVVLAGGVVRGIAHIGVLRALEENYIPINGLSGTSMGSIIGGLYACGYSPDSLESIIKEEIDWKTFFQDQQQRTYTPIWERIRNKPRPPAMEIGLTWKPPFVLYKPGTGIRIAQKFTDEIADKTLGSCYRAGFDFHKLPYPFGAMIVNLNSGKSELRVKGTLSTALRASASVPVAFEPMIIEGKQYIDGGILDNLPVDAFLQDFDTARNPDTIITIHDEKKGEDIFIIASYPSKLRGERNKATETGEEMTGLLGIGVLNKSSCFAREFHVWNSWDNADGQIDIDVKGGFDFNKEKLEELIEKGYCAAMMRVYDIKKELTKREDSLNPIDKNREIFEVSSVKLFRMKGNDTLKVEETNKVKKAIRFKEGSYIEKNDVCYAMRNIYAKGDYENVGAKIDKKREKIDVEFFLTNKEEDLDKFEIILRMGDRNSYDSIVAERIGSEMIKKGRSLSFNEIKEITEKEYVNRGYVSPLVVGAEFSSFGDEDVLFIYGNRGKKITKVKIVTTDSSNIRSKLEEAYGNHLSPERILKDNGRVYKEYQLRTIAVEGIKDDTLIIRARPKTGHTLECPALSFDKDQGINLFGELRTKPIRGFGNRSFYLNYGQNFPVKEARELLRGYSYNIGVNRCSPMRSFLWSLIPDLSVGNRRLRYPGRPDTSLYDMQYDEYLYGSVSYPIYIFFRDFGLVKDLAIIPGIEYSWRRYINDSSPDSLDLPFCGFLRLEYDDLDRFVFPSSGIKIHAGTTFDLEERLWYKLKVKGTFVKSFRIQSKLKTAFTGEFYESRCSDRTPLIERYSMGGITPVGSYQLRLYDFEDLPCYTRNKFLEPYMLKFGGSARLTLTEIEVLGLRLNLHLIGSLYAASTADSFFPLWECNKGTWYYSQSLGFYLDTSVLNIGVGWANTDKNLYHDIYLSVVLYGAGL